MMNFRETGPNDAHHLLDIDIKGFDCPWTPEEWREVSKDCVGMVATWNDTPIAFVISKRTEDGDIEIVKLAVKPWFRRQGISRRLVWNCVLHAREIMATNVLIVIPERRIDPGQPTDLTAWLTKLQFKAVLPIIKNHFHCYGEDEDGVIFALAVPLS